MHETALADAVRPARFFILGIPLLPYSIGHEIILLAQRNPILFEGFESLDIVTKKQSVIRAVQVCERSWKNQIKRQRWMRFWSWKNRNTDYALAIADFKNYRDLGSTFPPTRPVSSGGRTLGAPIHATLIQFLIGILGKSETEAYDYPMGLAMFHFYSFLEKDGQLNIVNSDEADFDKWCEEQDAIAEKKAKEAKCQL